MKHPPAPVLRDIVLIGGGHSHVVVLKMFAMNPVSGVRLTLICRDTHTPYSGMLPGFIAGHYNYDQVHIDLRKLAEFAGARFLNDEVTGLDRSARKVLCKTRPPLSYDWVSVNIGSTPQISQIPGADQFAVPVKPIFNFNRRWQMLLDRIKTHSGPLHIGIVGAGAGGVEMTLAMQFRLQKEIKKQRLAIPDLHFSLFTRNEQILPTHNERVREKFLTILRKRRITLHCSEGIKEVRKALLVGDSGKTYPIDEVLWVTQAGGAPWLEKTGLPLDDQGFIKVNDCLQSLCDERVFAAGDVATMVNHPREKAGVFAVRQGMPLERNLRRVILGQEPVDFTPQEQWLSLISTGDKYAVASKGQWFFAGKWVWRWKDWIDQRFMKKFCALAPMAESIAKMPSIQLDESEKTQAISAVAMRCGGCGAKVGSSILSQALADIHPVEDDRILVGLKAPDDAAVVMIPPGMAAVHSIDFFRAFVDDPWVFGKIAANHSLGDLFAMGATPQSATAVATVPPGLESKVKDTVAMMMGGAVEVLNAAGCALVGGHTGEGQELALGFAVNGYIDPKRILQKGRMKPGQSIILTKPLGTGTLFAANKKLLVKGRWIDQALESMCLSNKEASRILLECGATACTDVTGFGLLGHLVEMTKPSEVDATLWLDQLPILEGAEETLALGIQSSLAPSNVRLRRAIRDQAKWVEHPRYGILFDPQTAGGLLATVPEESTRECLLKLVEAGYPASVVIGKVLPMGDELSPITLMNSPRD